MQLGVPEICPYVKLWILHQVHKIFMLEEENPYSWIIKPFYGSETAVQSVEGGYANKTFWPMIVGSNFQDNENGFQVGEIEPH